MSEESSTSDQNRKITHIRNIAVVAHVDHGKTSLIDSFLKMKQERGGVTERAMDSNAIEKERGITILSKCTAIDFINNNETFLVNILDTPGHADFGGEVERVLNVVDAVLLVIDAAEGPMPQTKFVLKKALERHLKVIVLINKIDKPAADVPMAQDRVLDLLMSYDENLIDVPMYYGSGRDGFAAPTLKEAQEMLEGKREKSVVPLLQGIIEHVPQPKILADDLQILITMVNIDPFFGKTVIGKLTGGEVKEGQNVVAVSEDGTVLEKFRVTRLQEYRGVKIELIKSAGVGQIVIITGCDKVGVNDTICLPGKILPLKGPVIDSPVMSITISCNTSPYQGKAGTKLTSSLIKNRLNYEMAVNPGLKLIEHGDSFEVFGRGELQLSVLLENMRREGFELTIGAPKICITEIKGVKYEPREQLTIDIDSSAMGTVTTKLLRRGAEYVDMEENNGRSRMVYDIRSRGLLGFRAEFVSDTKGDGILNRVMLDLVPLQGEITTRVNGVLIASETGTSREYALLKREDRGSFFIGAGVLVYEGMIVGENNQPQDLRINVVDEKKLSNVRSVSKDAFSRLTPPKEQTLEGAISYIQSDECIELTPDAIRMRKVILR